MAYVAIADRDHALHDPQTFMRIHRSTIVNVRRIREIHPWFGGIIWSC